MEDQTPKRPITIMIPDEFYYDLKRIKNEEGITINFQIIKAIELYLEK